MGDVKKRPVNLNLFTIRFPVNALLSICHRLSGILLFLLLPFILYLFSLSVKSENSFISISNALAEFFLLRFTIFIYVSAFSYHLFAGVRHLFMDLHLLDSKAKSINTAYLLILASASFIGYLAYIILL